MAQAHLRQHCGAEALVAVHQNEGQLVEQHRSIYRNCAHTCMPAVALQGRGVLTYCFAHGAHASASMVLSGERGGWLKQAQRTTQCQKCVAHEK
eukprot:172842-Pelagomonas_calceolata.AAC.4